MAVLRLYLIAVKFFLCLISFECLYPACQLFISEAKNKSMHKLKVKEYPAIHDRSQQATPTLLPHPVLFFVSRF